MSKALIHEKTGRKATLSDEDPMLETFLANGWKEIKTDGPRKSRRSGTVSAKGTDDAGADEG